MHRVAVRTAVAASLLLLASVGCASGGTSSGTGATVVVPDAPAHRNTITEAEIPAGSTENAWELVQRLHPEFLRARVEQRSLQSRGAELPSLIVEGRRIGDVTELRQVPARLVGRINSYTVEETKRKFGMNFETASLELIYRR